jgi:hypothetical protein
MTSTANFAMTRYDKLIDCITDVIYTWYVTGQMDSQFDNESAKRDAHEILEMVEEYQSSPLSRQWRASD